MIEPSDYRWIFKGQSVWLHPDAFGVDDQWTKATSLGKVVKPYDSVVVEFQDHQRTVHQQYIYPRGWFAEFCQWWVNEIWTN